MSKDRQKKPAPELASKNNTGSNVSNVVPLCEKPLSPKDNTDDNLLSLAFVKAFIENFSQFVFLTILG